MADEQTKERYDDVDALLGDLDDEEESYENGATQGSASGVESILGSSSLSNLETISAEAQAIGMQSETAPSSAAAPESAAPGRSEPTMPELAPVKRDKTESGGAPLIDPNIGDANAVRRIAPIGAAKPIAPITVPGTGAVPAKDKFPSYKEKLEAVKPKSPADEPKSDAADLPDGDEKDDIKDREDKHADEKIAPKSEEKSDVKTEEKPSDDPQTSSPKRPPVPPKMPAVPSNARILRDNETAYTPEALNDILPGGKNDDGRDLAFDFADNNWYASVFNEDYLRTLPRSLPRQTLREVRFIVEKLGVQRGARVLDLCCGAGRHTVELASKGFDMVGVDLSMFLLKRALDSATKRKLSIKFVHGDMRKLTFRSIFDAVFNVQTSFGYFDDLTNFKVLQSIYASLKPGGVFLIETLNRDFIMDDMPLRMFWMGDGCKVLEESDVDPLSGVLKVKRSIVLDDQSRPPYEQVMNIRLYSAAEMRQLLKRAGFNVIELVGDFTLPDPRHFGAYSQHNIFVAEKPIASQQSAS